VLVGVLNVTLVRVLVLEATLAVIVGTAPLTNAEGNVTASDPVTATCPHTILYGMPFMTLVLNCAAVSVLPAVNVNLPDISGLSIVGKWCASSLA